jgi:acyl-coenzyme A synthetase/AMP-(fatty) acid ligase
MAIKAVIAPDAGVTLRKDAVLRHCAAHLEDFMVPKHVEFRDALPKSENGKIDRRGIAAELQGAVR